MKIHHDIIGDGFNIDHILISTKGVYLIETKTYSKPLKGKTEIEFDGLDFYHNGVKYNDNIQDQVFQLQNLESPVHLFERDELDFQNLESPVHLFHKHSDPQNYHFL